jgi:hypothetical protein
MLNRLPKIRALTASNYSFSNKKIEIFINGTPYQVKFVSFRLITIFIFSKQLNKMVSKYQDFVIMKDLK